MKTMAQEREELSQRLIVSLESLEHRDLLIKTIETSFNHGARCAHERAKLLLTALEDFQKSIYNIIGGEKE